MAGVLEFLTHKLNRGRNPIGYFVSSPESVQFETPEQADSWSLFLGRLDAGLFISTGEILSWIVAFAEIGLSAVNEV